MKKILLAILVVLLLDSCKMQSIEVNPDNNTVTYHYKHRSVTHTLSDDVPVE